jgi:hypothetical protein
VLGPESVPEKDPGTDDYSVATLSGLSTHPLPFVPALCAVHYIASLQRICSSVPAPVLL